MNDSTGPKPEPERAADTPADDGKLTFSVAARAAQVDEKLFYELVDKILSDRQATPDKPEMTN